MVENEKTLYNYASLFYRIFFITLILKLLLSYFFPLTGDEAYFITTGQKFYLGYYEHPPMVWWLIYLFSFLGKKIHHFFFYRLLSVFSTVIVAFLILKLLKKIDKKKGFLVASLFLLSPVHILGFLITTDTPLFIFTFLSGIFFYYGIEKGEKNYFVLSGIFWGLSFLSKYFSVLYLLSILIYLFYRKEKKIWLNFILFLIASLPFIFINLYWNYTHCWINILFNLVHRKRNYYFQITNLIAFFFSLFFLLTPYIFYLLFKNRFLISKKNNEDFNFFLFVFAIPVIFFFILSFIRMVGLHWYLSFIPFIFILAKNLEEKEILKSLKIAFLFEIFIIIPIIFITFCPVNLFKNFKKYSEIVMFGKPYSLCEYIKKFEKRYILATPGYTESAIMSYYCRNNFIVFGSFDHSGRQYDFSFDFKEIDGKDILIFSTYWIDKKIYENFFEEIIAHEIIVEDAKFYLLFCKKFNYQNYRDIILRQIYERFYKIPKFLPFKGNFFKEKYNL
ncbi:MAG: glycosyltransferase family 39 protein [Candidatus Omnitrophica bacterium]|nr:glycosyltransferase family 39 protein [Candidatus Omnitrophota bacterium]